MSIETISNLGRKSHIKSAAHGVPIRLGCHVRIFVPVLVTRNLPGEFLRVLNNTGNLSVDFVGHLVEEVCHLEMMSMRSLD